MALRTNNLSDTLADMQVNLAGVAMDSIVDGPGIRVAIFTQGCPHHCKGCHNPNTHSFGTGQNQSVQELYALVKTNPLARGVTFSGGEPFAQSEALAALAALLKADGYELAAYSGYTFEQLMDTAAQDAPARRAFLEKLDILIDGPFVQAERNLDLRFRGSANQRILAVPKSLAENTPLLCEETRWIGEAKP